VPRNPPKNNQAKRYGETSEGEKQVSRTKREFSEIGGFVSEGTKENRRYILALDALFLGRLGTDDDQGRQQLEDEEHQQHEEGE